MIDTEVLVLGAGLAGLSTAIHLSRPYLLVERAERVGGLCRTDVREGFAFDRTGHWLHLRDPGIRALCEEALPGGFVTVERRAGVWSHGTFTRYPYQVNTHGLPPEVVAENVLGFIRAKLGEEGRALREREPKSFEELVLRQLGEGFARNFMLPYNAKLWTVHPRELSTGWMGRFVPLPTLEQVVRGALGLEGDAAGYNATFLYPRQGGIEALVRALEARLPLPARCATHPLEIDLARRTALLSSGEEVRFRQLVSTIPLPELVALLPAVPDPVREAAGRLRATTVTYVNVAARDVGALPFHWVYLPEAHYRPYRVGSASAAVPTLAPPGYRSFYVEMSGAGPVPPAEAEAAALDVLLELGFVRGRGDIVFQETRVIPNAYVIPDADYGPSTEAVVGWLRREGVLLAGRQGRWEYSSMEDAILEGRECAREVG